MKRLFSLLLAATLALGALVPAHATLTNSSTITPYLSNGFITHFYAALITATANDTTATADSNTISNINGDIRDIYAGVKVTNQTGTSPTLTVKFLGSFDNATWFVIQGAQGGTAGTLGTMISPTLDISTASTTNVSTGTAFSLFGLPPYAVYPPYIRVRITVGGSSTPGWTGVAYAFVKRQGKVGN